MPLFNSGNPSLVGLTRLYAADPSGSANPLWTDQQVKDAINLSYDDLLQAARQLGVGWELKIGYDTAVDGTAAYALPSDFQRLHKVEISQNGSNLSTAAPSASDILVLEPTSADVAREAYDTQQITVVKYVHVEGTNYVILAPPGAAYAGTNSIKLIYEGETTLLSGDTDEPAIPRPHHELIALKAAVKLLQSRRLPIGDLMDPRNTEGVPFKQRAFLGAVHDILLDADGTIAVSRDDGGSFDRVINYGMVVGV